jgi:hypothetical protein
MVHAAEKKATWEYINTGTHSNVYMTICYLALEKNIREVKKIQISLNKSVRRAKLGYGWMDLRTYGMNVHM